MGGDERMRLMRPELVPTHITKMQLLDLLAELAPEKKWPKRVRLKDLADWAFHHLDADSANPQERRAHALAAFVWGGGRNFSSER